MTSRRTTQRDVARQAGVGRSSVSLALKGHPKISSETRERILRAAESLGYSPEPIGRRCGWTSSVNQRTLSDWGNEPTG